MIAGRRREEEGLELALEGGALNTDDRNLLEYGFARALSKENTFETTQVLAMAIEQDLDVPAHLSAQIDCTRLTYERLRMLAADGASFDMLDLLSGEDQRRAEAVAAFAKGDFATVLAAWTGTPSPANFSAWLSSAKIRQLP